MKYRKCESTMTSRDTLKVQEFTLRTLTPPFCNTFLKENEQVSSDFISD